MSDNSNMNRALDARDDEFYTMRKTVDAELPYYKSHLKGKIIYCNCDNPKYSEFWKHLYDNFYYYGLKLLIATYADQNPKKVVYDGVNVTETDLLWFGNFDSAECLDILQDVDIVISNPPFTQSRQYIEMMFRYNKQFLAVQNAGSVHYVEDIFPALRDGKMWLGVTGRIGDFKRPDGSLKNVNACFFTNIKHGVPKRKLDLKCLYSAEKYPKFSNYDAINVDKISEIPCDYQGMMGVPTTIFYFDYEKYFTIVDSIKPRMNGAGKYQRTIIQKTN